MPQNDLTNKSILFVTGKLAEAGLREVLPSLSDKLGFQYDLAVPGIQVAALLHVNLLMKRLEVPAATDLVMLPGWVQGDVGELERHFGTRFAPHRDRAIEDCDAGDGDWAGARCGRDVFAFTVTG